MNRIERRVRATVNPLSTALTGSWCHSVMRHMLTGYGPTARQRQLIRHETRRASTMPSAEQMKARATAMTKLLGRDDHDR
jgi:hypothetical protein